MHQDVAKVQQRPGKFDMIQNDLSEASKALQTTTHNRRLK